MKRILVASDRTEGSKNALGRACRMARAMGAELRIVSVLSEEAPDEKWLEARQKIHELVEGFPGCPPGIELDFLIRLATGDPIEGVLDEAAQFRPDILIMGGHGEPRLRDAIFGTTASHVVRRADCPVLVVQNDHALPYRKVMAAIDQQAAEQVLDLAFGIATAEDLFVVHAFGATSIFGDGELIEDVRTENDVLILKVRQKAREAHAASPSVHVHNLVEQGEVTDVIMRAWTVIRPDLLVMGTHGRTGLARLLHRSYAESALLGCPSDILVMRAADQE